MIVNVELHVDGHPVRIVVQKGEVTHTLRVDPLAPVLMVEPAAVEALDPVGRLLGGLLYELLIGGKLTAAQRKLRHAQLGLKAAQTNLKAAQTKSQETPK